MTNEERCLKMMKLERYKSDLTQEKRKLNYSTVVLCFAAFSLTCCASATYIDNSVGEVLTRLGSLINATAIPIFSASVIESICKKAGLERIIKDLELDLEFLDMSSKGRRL